MDNQISMQWYSITGIFNRVPIFPITLIDVEILNNWHANPSVWEVERSQQHSWCVLAMVHYTLVASHKSSPIIVYRASFIYIPTHQARTSLTDALKYLKRSKEDCVIMVSTPTKPTSPLNPGEENTTPCCLSTTIQMQIEVHWGLSPLLLSP